MQQDGGLLVPSWALGSGAPPTKRAAADAEGGGGAAKRTNTAAAKPNKKEDLTELVVSMGKLVLSQDGDIRDLYAATFVTALLPAESAVALAALSANEGYTKGVEELRAKAKEAEAAGTEIDRAAMGSPHLHVLVAVLKAMIENAEEAEGKTLRAFWESTVGRGPEVVLEAVTICRAKKPPKQGRAKGAFKDKQYVKFQFGMRDKMVEAAMVSYLIKNGAEKLQGGAPRGWLARDVSARVAKLSK